MWLLIINSKIRDRKHIIVWTSALHYSHSKVIVGVNLNENWMLEFQQLSDTESDTLNETWDEQEGILNVYTK